MQAISLNLKYLCILQENFLLRIRVSKECPSNAYYVDLVQ